MADEKVAVIIPVFNRAQVVREALDSVALQIRPPDVLIVVDDGSTDGSADSVEAWRKAAAAPFPVKLLRQDNRGAAAARNAGLAVVADAELVAFLDSDDLWSADFLRRTTTALRQAPAAVGVTVDRLICRAALHRQVHESLAPLAQDATRWLFTNHGGIASASLFRTALIRRCGGFPEELPTGHDVALFFRLSLCGPWLHAPGQPVAFRRGLAADRGEADHVCKVYSDYHRQWAEIWERLAAEGVQRLPRSVCRRVVASRWHRAGKQLARQRRWDEARDCFQRALAWRWSPKTAFCSWRCGWRSRQAVASAVHAIGSSTAL